jgi:hypothetical protein
LKKLFLAATNSEQTRAKKLKSFFLQRANRFAARFEVETKENGNVLCVKRRQGERDRERGREREGIPKN